MGLLQKTGDVIDEYSRQLYSIASANKIPLTYLQNILSETASLLPEYQYHSSRLNSMLELLANASFLFNKEDVNYAIFKTLKPGLDDVSDIDVLCLGPYDYSKIVTALKQNDYLFIKKAIIAQHFRIPINALRLKR